MKSYSSVLLAAIATAAFVSGAAAIPTGDGPGAGPRPYPMDCTTAKDKVRCEALNKDIAACKDKVGDEWRECMHRPASTAKFTPPKLRNCDKAHNKTVCETHNAALEACKNAPTRGAHRKCMAAQLPAPTPKKR